MRPIWRACGHLATKCPFKGMTCHKCGKLRCLKQVCRAGGWAQESTLTDSLSSVKQKRNFHCLILLEDKPESSTIKSNHVCG